MSVSERRYSMDYAESQAHLIVLWHVELGGAENHAQLLVHHLARDRGNES